MLRCLVGSRVLCRASYFQISRNVQHSAESNSSDLVPETDFSELAQLPEHLLSATDIGLTWFAPTSLVFNIMTSVHNSTQLPWWATIACSTAVMRVGIFPLLIKSMKKSDQALGSTNELKELVGRAHSVRQRGDPLETMKYSEDVAIATKQYYKKILGFLTIPLLQGCVFSSFFLSIRAMSYFPIPSLKTGGFGYLINLTESDPYFILPIITASTTFLVLRAGVDFGPSTNSQMKYMPYVLPPLVLLTSSQFPAAICVYWVSNNFISLVQSLFLKTDYARKLFKLPPKRSPAQMDMGADDKFKADLKAANELMQESLHLRQQENLEKMKLIKKEKHQEPPKE